MKVLHLISGLRVGGAERFLLRLAAHLKSDHGVEQRIVSMTDIGPVGQQLRQKGFVVDELGINGIGTALSGGRKLRLVIKEFDPDIVQSWMYHADLLSGTIGRLFSKAPVIWNVRCSDPPLRWRTARIVDLCAAISRFGPSGIIMCGERARDVHAMRGFRQSKMRVIQNGYLFPLEDPLSHSRRMERANRDECVIGAAGRFAPEKDFGNLLQAMAILLSENHRIKVRIAGRGCDEQNLWFSEQLAKLGIGAAVELLGEVGDMNAFYADLDLFCLPSLSEGFPNVLCEAMASGLPVVSTDSGDAADIVNVGGEVVPIADPVALADAMRMFIQMTGENRRRVGAAGAAMVRRRFGMDEIADRYVEFYRQHLS